MGCDIHIKKLSVEIQDKNVSKFDDTSTNDKKKVIVLIKEHRFVYRVLGNFWSEIDVKLSFFLFQ